MKAASWHGRLALFYGPLQRYDLQDIDICRYTKAVLKGALAAACIAVCLSVLGLFVVSTLLNVYFWLVWGINLQADSSDLFAGIGLIIPMLMVACVLLTAWYYIECAFYRWRIKRAHEREAGFLEQAVDAKRNRMCFKLSFADIPPAPTKVVIRDFDSRF